MKKKVPMTRIVRISHIKQPDSNRSHYLLAYANELTEEGLVARSEALDSVFANMAG